jgi:quinol monooxygenase YgiN
MIVLTAYGVMKPDASEAVLEACRKNKALAVLEQGCERFDYFVSPENPEKFVFVEEWTSKRDLDAHFETPHFAAFMQVMQECLIGMPEVRIFDAYPVP